MTWTVAPVGRPERQVVDIAGRAMDDQERIASVDRRAVDGVAKLDLGSERSGERIGVRPA